MILQAADLELCPLSLHFRGRFRGSLAFLNEEFARILLAYRPDLQ